MYDRKTKFCRHDTKRIQKDTYIEVYQKKNTSFLNERHANCYLPHQRHTHSSLYQLMQYERNHIVKNQDRQFQNTYDTKPIQLSQIN